MSNRSKSSDQWLKEHRNDRFVQKAKVDGYRGRAAYKLLEIQGKDRLIQPGMTVVDLGAAPGAWSQIASQLVGKKGHVIALDILPMEPVAPNVLCLEGDFQDDDIYQQLLQAVAGKPVDVVICDISPNISGNKAIDQPRVIGLVELALDFSLSHLRQDGSFLTKIFHGEGFDQYFKGLGQYFDKVVTRKPEASRSRSREAYLLGKGFKS